MGGGGVERKSGRAAPRGAREDRLLRVPALAAGERAIGGARGRVAGEGGGSRRPRPRGGCCGRAVPGPQRPRHPAPQRSRALRAGPVAGGGTRALPHRAHRPGAHRRRLRRRASRRARRPTWPASSPSCAPRSNGCVRGRRPPRRPGCGSTRRPSRPFRPHAGVGEIAQGFEASGRIGVSRAESVRLEQRAREPRRALALRGVHGRPRLDRSARAPPRRRRAAGHGHPGPRHRSSRPRWGGSGTPR